MSMEIEYRSVADFGEIITGKTPSTSVDEFWSGEIPFITPTDIVGYDMRYIFSTERQITDEGANSQINTILPKNTICVSCIASIGKMCITSAAQSITNQQINSIVVKKEYDYQYLFYLLRYFLPYIQLIGGGTGSGTPIISKTKFSKLKYPVCVDKAIQARIAVILSTYDSLIEVNNKRIKVLEQIAENLYKEWFVRFRFPGHETAEFVDSRIGRIPSSFAILKMQDILEFYIGGGWGNDDEDNEYPIQAYVIRGTDFPRVTKGDLSSCPLRHHKKSNYSTRQLEPDDVILEVSGGTAEQPVGRTLLVTADTIDRFGGKVICASFCKQMRVKKELISPIFFYYWMQFLYNTRIIDRFQLQSTGIINFRFEYFLRKGDVMLPNKEIMDEFDGKVRTIYSEISIIARQTENLIKQRDLLLPRLMSGKLEV